LRHARAVRLPQRERFGIVAAAGEAILERRERPMGEAALALDPPPGRREARRSEIAQAVIEEKAQRRRQGQKQNQMQPARQTLRQIEQRQDQEQRDDRQRRRQGRPQPLPRQSEGGEPQSRARFRVASYRSQGGTLSCASISS
jgi:hypothetical protein